MRHSLTAARVKSWMIFFHFTLLFFIFLPAVSHALTPVARWDVVPYQRITYGSFLKIGVIAFSKPGINSVEITPSGQGYSGGIKTVTAMTFNSQTEVYEYWTTLSASDFTGNGAIAVTAVVYDNDNNFRNLSLSLIVEGAGPYTHKVAWVDAVSGNDSSGIVGSESAPYKTIGAAVSAAQTANGGSSNGNIIYLKEGTYSVSGVSASTTTEWLTITKDDTAAVEKVIINTGVLATGYLKYDSVTLQSRGTNLYVATDSSTRLWTNNCRRIGSGRGVANTNPVHLNDPNNHFSTNDYTYNVDLAYRQAALVRGATISTIGNDAFQNTSFVVNTTLDNISNGTNPSWHADVYQVHTTGVPPANNRIIYNYKATDVHYQGIFMRSDAGMATDNAFVNVLIEMREPADDNETGGYAFTAFAASQSWDHLIVRNCTFLVGHSEVSATFTNSSFVGNAFYQFLHNSTAIGDPIPAFAEPGNAGNNEFLYNHFNYVYKETESCTANTRFVAGGWPCPHWYAKRPDTLVTGSATTGGGVIDLTDPAAVSFGAPVANSVLIDRLPFPTVPADIYGNPRVGKPEVGAIEISSSLPPPPSISTPAGFQVK